jgi:type I restriction enzyme M protein
MLNSETKRRIDSARDILVGQLPLPSDQVELITIALIYKFMDDIDEQSREMGGKATFFVGNVKLNGRTVKLADLNWRNLVSNTLDAETRVARFAQGIEALSNATHIPDLFKSIFKNTFLKFRDGRILKLFLDEISGFSYDHSEDLGNAFEYLLSAMGSQGENGQFRTPRHIIDFIVDVVDPQKEDKILDPACGTAGFLISAYKHILEANTSPRVIGSDARHGDLLTGAQKKKLTENIVGYDITPLMTRLSRVNMYLHHFANPTIHEYDTLNTDTRWEEKFDCILANPPFMTPKGGTTPHNKFRIPSTRAEVLFSDYIVEHLTPNGKAGFIVPEGIIFQSQNAYKDLRRMLVEEYLWAVVSLPAGVFNPYAGVKTSILLLDRTLARREKEVLFVKVEADGFDLGAQRRPIEANELPATLKVLTTWKEKRKLVGKTTAHVVERKRILESSDYNLSGDRYLASTARVSHEWPTATLDELCEFSSGLWKSERQPLRTVRILRNTNFTKFGTLNFDDVAEHPVESRLLPEKLLKPGDILIEKSGGGPTQPVGRVALFNVEGDFSFSNFTARMRLKNGEVKPQYLWHVLHFLYKSGVTERLQKRTSGIRNLDFPAFKEIRIPLPLLEEQEWLVAELEGYRQIIESARQILTHYKPTLRINPDWPLTAIADVAESTLLGVVRNKGEQHPEHPVPYIKMNNITADGRLELGDLVYVEATSEELERFSLADGDFIYNTRNAPDLVGKSAVFHGPSGKFLFNNNILRIRFGPKAHPDFVNTVMNSGFGKALIRAQVDGTTSVAALYQKNYLAFEIPLPPIAEQRRLVTELEAERALVEANRELAARFEQKLQSRLAEIWGEAPAEKTKEIKTTHPGKSAVPA